MSILILIISAVTTALTLVFSELSFLTWVSIAPFIYIMIVQTEKKSYFLKSLLYGFIWFFSYYFVIFHWFTYLYPMEFVGAYSANRCSGARTQFAVPWLCPETKDSRVGLWETLRPCPKAPASLGGGSQGQLAGWSQGSQPLNLPGHMGHSAASL